MRLKSVSNCLWKRRVPGEQGVRFASSFQVRREGRGGPSFSHLVKDISNKQLFVLFDRILSTGVYIITTDL